MDSWEDFAAVVAAIAEIDAAAIQRDSRLIGDLGLDSLALVELVVTLVERYEMVRLVDELEQRDWTTTTVGQLFDEAHRPAGAI